MPRRDWKGSACMSLSSSWRQREESLLLRPVLSSLWLSSLLLFSTSLDIFSATVFYWVKSGNATLTITTVGLFSLPPGKTHDLSLFWAGKVSILVVSRSAHGWTIISIVIFIAGHTDGIVESSFGSTTHFVWFVGPIRSDLQRCLHLVLIDHPVHAFLCPWTYLCSNSWS